MSMTKDMWMDEVERATDDFAMDKLTREEALNKLCRLGLDLGEATDLLNEAIS